MSDVIVDLITPQGEVLDNTSIPQDYLVRQVIDEFVDHMGLPRYMSGQAVDYSMRWVNRNITLDPQVSLQDAGVGAGDQLKLVSSVDLDGVSPAGGGFPESAPSGYTNPPGPATDYGSGGGYTQPPDGGYSQPSSSGFGSQPYSYTAPGGGSGYTDPGGFGSATYAASGAAVAEATIEVLLSVLDLNRSANEQLDLDMTVEQLIQHIARKYDLPDHDELNVAATYRLKSKALGRMIGPGETLRSAGVPKHDRLAILREEIAG